MKLQGRRKQPRRSCRALALFGLAAAAALAGCGAGPKRPTSVILIVLDTVRADHLGAYGYTRPTSPALDRWAARGALLERGWASSPWTLPSFGSIFTGRLPVDHAAGYRLTRKFWNPKIASLAASVPTLPEILSDHGYATAAIVNNPFLEERFGIARGFETYDYVNTNNQHLRRADVVVNRALQWLEQRDPRRFLLVLHLFDPHMQYDPPEQTRGRFTRRFQSSLALPIANGGALRLGFVRPDARDRRFIAAAYDEEILFVDIHVGRFLDQLEQRGLLDDALVLLTADHGEELWDHGGFEHGHSVYQEVLHVPFLFWGPGVRPGRIPTPVSHVDILPTVLDALGIPGPGDLAGASLWPLLSERRELPERTLVAEGTLYGDEHKALMRWPWKLTVTDGEAAPALFDLARDPDEQTDLAAEKPAVLRELLGDLEERYRLPPPDRDDAPAAELDEAAQERLQSLGYFEP